MFRTLVVITTYRHYNFLVAKPLVRIKIYLLKIIHILVGDPETKIEIRVEELEVDCNSGGLVMVSFQLFFVINYNKRFLSNISSNKNTWKRSNIQSSDC